MDEVANVEKVQEILKFTVQLTNDCESSALDGQALIKACHAYNAVIDEVLQEPHLPISNELKNVHTTLETTNTLIDEFLKQDDEQHKAQSLWSDAGWKVQRKRRHLIRQIRAVIKSTTEQLNFSQKELHNTLRFSAHCFKEVMVNDACFKFWKRMCGNKIQLSDWSIFAETYQRQFNESWATDELEERIRRVACSSKDMPLSISGYITLTNKCGFPIDYIKVPHIPGPRTTEMAQSRMSMARMINEMIRYYYSETMRDFLEIIFTWYEGCNKRNREAWQARANEWSETIKANRGKRLEELDEHQKLAEQVDTARQTYSSFFLRLMVLFKVGQISRDMLAEVDFPGRARVYEFFDYVGPLEKANFTVLMNIAEEKWETKQPKVYKLLQEYIDESKRLNANAAPAAVTGKMLKHIRLDDGTVIPLPEASADAFLDKKLRSDVTSEIQ
ncbi:unnamed protein product [Absidia cylindrospora]